MLIPTEKEIIRNFCGVSLNGGLKCPICGKVVYWITYAHAAEHDMTRAELRKVCKPFGTLKDADRINKRMAAKKSAKNIAGATEARLQGAI